MCNPVGSRSVFSSGSPVQVNSFRQNLGGQDKIQFSFDIVHSDQGNVFETSEGDSITADDCPKDPRERRQKENRVMVNIDTGLATDLKCVGMVGSNGVITLGKDRRTITCTQELDPNRNDFETNVDITLDFNYRDFADQEVLVKHLFD